jgi:hypothetical protein
VKPERAKHDAQAKHDAYANAAYCFRSQRCASASQTQSANRRLRSGKSGSPLTRKFNRSQSSSPGHLPVHTPRRGSSPWKCAQPSAAQPQCGQRSMSHPLLWRCPIAAPQSGQGPRFIIRFRFSSLAPEDGRGLAITCRHFGFNSLALVGDPHVEY